MGPRTRWSHCPPTARHPTHITKSGANHRVSTTARGGSATPEMPLAQAHSQLTTATRKRCLRVSLSQGATSARGGLPPWKHETSIKGGSGAKKSHAPPPQSARPYWRRTPHCCPPPYTRRASAPTQETFSTTGAVNSAEHAKPARRRPQRAWQAHSRQANGGERGMSLSTTDAQPVVLGLRLSSGSSVSSSTARLHSRTGPPYCSPPSRPLPSR